jgi:hypothetical protein
MTDLATQSLGQASAGELSLSERRANYEDWKTSSHKAMRSTYYHTSRTDDKPPLSELQTKRAAVEAADKARLINPIPPGAVVRIDDDDPKNKREIDPETRARLAAAVVDLLKPTRADDGSQEARGPISGLPGEQPPAPAKPGSSPLNRQDDEEEKPRKATDDDEAPTIRTVMDAIGALNKRLDAIEGRNEDGDGEGEGSPKPLAADDSALQGYRRNREMLENGQLGRITCDSITVDEFAKIQYRADRVYGAWGKSAPKPMHGEELNNYRRRLLQPYQHYSPAFAKSNLKVLAVDGPAFDHAEEEIWKAAFDAVRDPSTVPLGVLRESVEVKNGHTHTKFYGRPTSWMAPFMGPGKRVKQINRNVDSNIGYRA